MPLDGVTLEVLKNILDNNLSPEQLDTHPWVESLFVRDVVTNDPGLRSKSPGAQLVSAVGKLFIGMMPSVPPRHGKRLDTRWGEFGLLAAQYFAPLLFGAPTPDSLRDAWGRIDQSILLFVFGKADDSINAVDREAYKLVGDEPGVAPNSTLSDWHRKGLQHLLDTICARENYLTNTPATPSAPLQNEGVLPIQGDNKVESEIAETPSTGSKKRKRRSVILLLVLIVLGLIGIAGLKVWKIYNMALLVYNDASQIQELAQSSDTRIQKAVTAGPQLYILRKDFLALKLEIEPYLWLGPLLKWVPEYGSDLASAKDLVDLADALLSFADSSYEASLPILDAVSGEGGAERLNPPLLAEMMSQSQPMFAQAKSDLDLILEIRSRLDVDNLSPRVRDLIQNKIDPMLPLMQDGMTLASEFPRLMGSTEEGPKTYLLLVQNEDELRPTGGFITAAGTILVRDGRISSIKFENSGYLDDWTKPYPVAPWQLSQYMNSPVLIFRDTNWFTNYPTAALYAEYLYSYISNHSVDGVIAFDQQMLVDILNVVGPIKLEGVSYSITADNVVSYMRASKTPTAEELASPEWNNKQFINKISHALVTKVFSGDIPWEQLSSMLITDLNEHHLMVQLDSPTMMTFLADHRWDGGVRPQQGDFLMVVDTNVGFNKTNAVIESSLFYDVDLTDLAAPSGSLTVDHKNNAVGITSCKHWDKVRLPGEKDYPINDCYWNYLRIYKSSGTTLTAATPQKLPANWMILNQSPPAEVDVLEEEIDNVQAFGTIQVVPGGQSLSVSFQFALPSNVLFQQADDRQWLYHLFVQKQPGTRAVPITIRVHLPNASSVLTMPDGALLEDDNILLETNLRYDLDLEVLFSAP